MQCPFLRETEVRFCSISPYGKVLEQSGPAASEKCSTPAYVTCPLVSGHKEALERRADCPFLRNALVQYCEAAPVVRFIPFSESLLSSCKTSSHRYCELYIARAEPERVRGCSRAAGASIGPQEAERPGAGEIPVPPALAYSSNHMWLDRGEDGVCHVGVDGFFAKVVGKVDRVAFATSSGIRRPTAILSVNGADLAMTFPLPLLLTGMNLRLKSEPRILVEDPYETGWMFEGRDPGPLGLGPDLDRHPDLLSGVEAASWMNRESRRLTDYVHEHLCQRTPDGFPVMNDGGVVSDGLAQHLNGEDLLLLFDRFLSARVTGRSPS